MTGSAVYAIGDTPVSAVAWLAVISASIVMLVAWIGALLRISQLRRWGWFLLVLIFQLLGLGIVGMVAYAAAGPRDDEIVARPTAT